MKSASSFAVLRATAFCCITLLLAPSVSFAFVGSPESGGGATESSVGETFGGSGGSSGSSNPGSVDSNPGTMGGFGQSPGATGPSGGFGGGGSYGGSESGSTGFEGSPEANPGAFGGESSYGGGSGGTGFEGSPEANPGAFGGETSGGTGFEGSPEANPGSFGVGEYSGAPSYFSESLVGSWGLSGNETVNDSVTVTSALDAVFGSLAGIAANVTPTGVQTISFTEAQQIANEFSSNVTIGSVPAPGPTDRFSGVSNPTNAPIDVVDVISFTGDLGRGQTTVTLNGDTANVTPASYAHFAALGRTTFTEEDVATLGALIAGEVRSSVASKIAEGTALTAAEMQEVSMVMASVAARFGADRGRTLGSQLTSFASTALAPAQYSAFNVGIVDQTTASYNRNAEAFNEVAQGWLDGSVVEEYGFGVAVPTVNGAVATHYSNEAVADISWQGGLVNRETYGPAGQAHTAGNLSNEYTSITDGTRDRQQGSYLSEVAQNMFSLPDRNIQSNADSINEVGAAFAISGGGSLMSFDPTTFSGETFTNIDTDDFVASLDVPTWDGTLGGIAIADQEVPTYDFSEVAISPTLAAAFEEVGYSYEEARDILSSVDLSISIPTVGSEHRSSQTGTAFGTGEVTVVVTREVPAIVSGTGFRTNINFQDQVNTKISEEARAMLNDIAGKVSFNITVTSGYRDVAHNAKVNGAKGSQHIHGHAVDISTSNLTKEQKAELADAIASTGNVNGWGLYSTSIHVDARAGGHASWGPDYSSGSLAQGYANQPEMEAAHRSWSEGTYATRPAEESVTTAISVSPADLAALEAINNAIAERNETTASTRGATEVPDGTTRYFTNTITRGATEVLSNVGKGLQSIFDRWFGRGAEDIDITPEEPSATTTTSYSPQGTILRVAHLITSTPVAHAQTTNIDSYAESDSKPNLLERFINWLFGSDETTETYTNLDIETVSGSSSLPYIPVFISIDESAHAIHLNRGEIQNLENFETEDGFGEDGIRQNVTGVSLLFDANGQILYSDGMYAPVYENGEMIDLGFKYVYFIEHVKDGEIISSERHDGSLPGNIFTRTWNLLLGDNSPFTLSEVASATYVFVDPDTTTPTDEYYDYRVTLTDGSIRSFAVPVNTTLAFYNEQLQRIGYIGDAFALTSIAQESGREERTPEAGSFTGLFETIASNIRDFSISDESDDRYTEFATTTGGVASDAFTPMRIEALTVYLDVPVQCPDGNVQFGYVYEVTFQGTKADGTPTELTGQEPRCGSGGPRTYVTEIASHLESFTGLAIDEERLLSIVEFSYNPPSVIVENTEEEPLIPNTTNQIAFEAKVTAAGGATVVDWTTGSVSVGSGQQLHLRWDATAYERCLPFIADNGAYSLSRSGNLTLTSGNTEAEGYDVFERAGTYRIECDGQQNGEDGVDERRIEITT